MSPRLGVLAAALVVPALPLVVSAPAHAATTIICVNRDVSETDCTSRPGDIQTAVLQATADNTDSVIRIGPGTYTGPFTFDGTASPLTVQGNNNGTGSNATLIQGGVTVTNATMRNVRVAAVNGGTALTVTSDASSSVGNVIVADTPEAPVSNATGILATGGRVVNTTVNLDRAGGNTGIQTSGTSTLSRVTTRTTLAGVVNTGGALQIDNALIVLGANAISGLRAGTGASTSATTASAKHLTVVGGTNGARGVWSFSDDLAAPATITLDNSVVWGPATSVSAAASGGTAELGVRYSDYQTEQELGGGQVTSVEGNLNVDPQFRAPASGDYELRRGSPVVDQASLGLTTGTDREDRGRAFDGDGNGSQVPDMGAFELSDITAPTATFTAGPSGLTNNRQPVFQFRTNENGARLECSLDGGAFQPCTSPATTPPLADGTHSFTIRSIDAAFNVENPPVTRTFTVDTVAPNATITKKPAKRFTKKRVKFKFAVDEPGATLQCNLDGKGWKKCNSVWKFNTKVGKHVMLVRAVDAADNVDATPARYKYKRLPQKKRR